MLSGFLPSRVCSSTSSFRSWLAVLLSTLVACLTPNGILHIACFITLCEAFLGIYPHWGLWRCLFNIKRTNSEYAVGQVGISIGDDNSYFDLEKIDSISGWQKSWFYLKDRCVAGQQFGLAPFNLDA